MRYRRADGGFGSGMGGNFGTSGYDPHHDWDGPVVTRGVGREGTRIPREHEDEHPAWGYGARGGSEHLSEWEARRHARHDHDWEGRRQQGYRGYGASAERWHGGQTNGPPYPTEYPPYSRELPTPHHQQHGYGLSQYAYPDEVEARWGRGTAGTDMGLGERVDRGPHYGKGPKGYRRSDERIREDVCENMSRQGFIDASDVEVTVEDAVVRLSGTVSTRQDKRALEQMTERVHGVDEVRNEIRLRRAVGRASAPSSARGQGRENANGRASHS